MSRHVLPRPADWPPTATTTGYWFIEATDDRERRVRPDSPLPTRLEEFLDAGEPPIFIGFGSMSGSDPAATTTAIVEAVEKSGTRAVLATGWGGIVADEITDDVFVIDEAPHDLLFPRVAAIVHHGGAGTTGAAVAAGRPQVVCPFVADQPFWGRRMHSLGVAPAPINQRRLTADDLADAIRQVRGDPAFAARALELGGLVRAEQGTMTAVAQLEQLAGAR